MQRRIGEALQRIDRQQKPARSAAEPEHQQISAEKDRAERQTKVRIGANLRPKYGAFAVRRTPKQRLHLRFLFSGEQIGRAVYAKQQQKQGAQMIGQQRLKFIHAGIRGQIPTRIGSCNQIRRAHTVRIADAFCLCLQLGVLCQKRLHDGRLIGIEPLHFLEDLLGIDHVGVRDRKIQRRLYCGCTVRHGSGILFMLPQRLQGFGCDGTLHVFVHLQPDGFDGHRFGTEQRFVRRNEQIIIQIDIAHVHKQQQREKEQQIPLVQQLFPFKSQ